MSKAVCVLIFSFWNTDLFHEIFYDYKHAMLFSGYFDIAILIKTKSYALIRERTGLDCSA